MTREQLIDRAVRNVLNRYAYSLDMMRQHAEAVAGFYGPPIRAEFARLLVNQPPQEPTHRPALVT